MSRPQSTEAVKLVASVLASETVMVNEVIKALSDRYGPADFISATQPFLYTDYYEPEMGSPLVRRFIALEDLVRPESLPDVKLWTNGAETEWAIEDRRRVNIDPGYISKAHLVLATGKGYTHRPYLRDGIYADLTLMYQNGVFHGLPWTYPDYMEESTRAMFKRIRGRYIEQLKNHEGAKPSGVV